MVARTCLTVTLYVQCLSCSQLYLCEVLEVLCSVSRYRVLLKKAHITLRNTGQVTTMSQYALYFDANLKT